MKHEVKVPCLFIQTGICDVDVLCRPVCDCDGNCHDCEWNSEEKKLNLVEKHPELSAVPCCIFEDLSDVEPEEEAAAIAEKMSEIPTVFWHIPLKELIQND